MLRELVQAPKVDKSLRLSGEPSYRVLRHPIADDFNYMNPGVQGQRQTDFVISRYKNTDYKMCTLDVVNAAAYLAFIDPQDAKEMEFSTEFFY